MGDVHDLPISSGKMVLMFFDDQASFLCAPSIFHLWKLGFGFPDPRVPNYRLICGWEAGYFAPISSKAFDKAYEFTLG